MFGSKVIGRRMGSDSQLVQLDSGCTNCSGEGYDLDVRWRCVICFRDQKVVYGKVSPQAHLPPTKGRNLEDLCVELILLEHISRLSLYFCARL